LSTEAASSPSPILVALGSDARTLRLVHAGFRMAREQGRPWVVVHVEVLGWETPEEADQARVWLQEAHELGAEVIWVKAPTVVGGLLAVARKRTPALLVLGENRSRGPWDRLESSRAQDLLHRSLDIRILALPLDSSTPKGPAFRNVGDVIGILGAVAVILTVTTIFAAALSVVAGFPAIPGMFALAAGFIAYRWGRGVSVLGTLGAFLIYAKLFARQGSGFSAETWPHFIFFAASLLGTQMLVDLVGRLRLETRAGRRREAETVLLMLLGRALARCSTVQEAAEVLAQRLHRLFQAEAWMLLPGENDQWTRLPQAEGAPDCPPPSSLLPELGATATREDPLEPLFVHPCSFVPLAGTGGTEGVLQLRLAHGGSIPQESWGLLQAFAVQGSLALERVRWVAAAQQAHMESETERVRSGLLGAVSHDLRTPLAAIQGAATSLLLPEEALSEATRRDLVVMIREESDRLTRLLGNLLDLTRLESGVIRVRKEWQPLDEVVGAVIGRLERGRGPFPVSADLPPDLPLVPIDGGLMEQVFFNLLINAQRHAKASEVLLEGWAGEGSVELAVSDRGPGVAKEFHSRVFDKFFRMPGQTTDGGVGLGLAICDAIVKAHGGRIWVEDRPGGGASFRITLPLGERPPDLPPDPEPEPVLPESGS
jgi:two-component system sensor histidine kinase KdpD